MSDWKRALAGHEKVAEAFQRSIDAGLAADEARRNLDERIAALLRLIVMRLDRIEAQLSNGDNDE